MTILVLIMVKNGEITGASAAVTAVNVDAAVETASVIRGAFVDVCEEKDIEMNSPVVNNYVYELYAIINRTLAQLYSNKSINECKLLNGFKFDKLIC